MSPHDLTGPHWFKSSYSEASANCVEVAFAGPAVGVRDSKNPEVLALVFPASAWSAFVARVDV